MRLTAYSDFFPIHQSFIPSLSLRLWGKHGRQPSSFSSGIVIQYCTLFLALYFTKCPGDHILIGHGIPIMQKRIRRQTCWQQNPCLWTKHERLKFTSLIISPGTVAIEWFLNLKLLSVQFYCLQCIIRFGRALCLLQPKHGVPAVLMHMSARLCFELVWGLNLMEEQWQACPRHRKNNRIRNHQICISIGPKSWLGFEQSVFGDFNRFIAGDRLKCAWLWRSVLPLKLLGDWQPGTICFPVGRKTSSCLNLHFASIFPWEVYDFLPEFTTCVNFPWDVIRPFPHGT